jgi:hypothetical protein
VIKLAKIKLSKRELEAKKMLAYSVCTDDGGTLFEAFVADSKAADILRDLLPKKFYGMRTVVAFIDVQEDDEDLDFYYSDDE